MALRLALLAVGFFLLLGVLVVAQESADVKGAIEKQLTASPLPEKTREPTRGFDDRDFEKPGDRDFGPDDRDFRAGPRDFDDKFDGPARDDRRERRDERRGPPPRDDKEDFGPPDKGPGPHFGPGPRFGPDFDLPPEAIEGMIFGEIGDRLAQKYGEENLMSKCDKQPELVALVFKELQESGLNLQEEFCSEMEEGISRCEENKKFCERIGREEDMPRFGPPGEEEFVPSCPPNKDQLKEVCKKRMQREFDQQFKDREEDMSINCEQRWEFEQPRFERECEGGEIRLPPFCKRDEFIRECLQRMPSDFGPPPQPEQPREQIQPVQPIQRGCPAKPQLPSEWYDNCNSQGGHPEQRSDSQGCVISIDCVFPPQPPRQPPGPTPVQPPAPPQPSPAPTVVIQPTTSPMPTPPQATPTMAPTPEATPIPTPAPTSTPAPTPEPTSVPAPSPTPEAKTAPSSYTGFFAARTPQEACDQEWSRNENMFNRQCEEHKRRGPGFNLCNKDAFVAHCRQEELSHMGKERQRLNYDRICELEVKRISRDMERFCKDTRRGREQCLKDTERGCDFGRKQLARCKEFTSPDRIKEAITKGVAKKCHFEKRRKRIDLRPIDLGELPASEIIPAVVATRENISPDEERQLREAVQRVESFYALSGLRVYSVFVKASDFGRVKQLPFVTDAKVDPIRRSLEALEKKEGRLHELDRAVTALEATQEFLPSDQRNLVSYETENLAQAKEKIQEASKDKGVAYVLQQFLGFKAEEERKEAEALKAESERLTSTTGRLKKLVDQVDDVALQAVLSEQIKELEDQQKSIQSRADAKKRGAAGILSLFGLLG